MWALGIRTRSSGKAISSLNFWAISPNPIMTFSCRHFTPLNLFLSSLGPCWPPPSSQHSTSFYSMTLFNLGSTHWEKTCIRLSESGLFNTMIPQVPPIFLQIMSDNLSFYCPHNIVQPVHIHKTKEAHGATFLQRSDLSAESPLLALKWQLRWEQQ